MVLVNKTQKKTNLNHLFFLLNLREYQFNQIFPRDGLFFWRFLTGTHTQWNGRLFFVFLSGWTELYLLTSQKYLNHLFFLLNLREYQFNQIFPRDGLFFFEVFYRAQTQADHYRIHRRMSVLWKEIKNQRKIKRKFLEKKKIFPSRSVRRATAAFYRVCLPSFSIFLFFFIYTNGILRERRTDLTAHRRDRERETDRWSRASFFFSLFFLSIPIRRIIRNG